jgi:erythromycin esterase-like protein
MNREQLSEVAAIRLDAKPLTGSSSDWDVLLDRIGDKNYVLLGEATHGTHEFYKARAEISQRLIMEKGFNTVCLEADWPAAYAINSAIKSDDVHPIVESFEGFKARFPEWMWRNTDFVTFAGWLREYNQELRKPHQRMVSLYGLDLYSLRESMAAVLKYLRDKFPEAAERCTKRYACFDGFEDSQSYGFAVSLGAHGSCKNAVVQQLLDMNRLLAQRSKPPPDEVDFAARQNARVVKSAEEYYREMFSESRDVTWNLRDSHMVDTVGEITKFFDKMYPTQPTKCIIWAHNSHLGDARWTSASNRGEHNVGQLMRERFPAQVYSVGFSTHTGTVAAASEWDGPVRHKHVRPSMSGSVEHLFHSTGIPRFVLPLVDGSASEVALRAQKQERAIGVIYRPETERLSHYFGVVTSRQFDAMIHYDVSRAVEPLDMTPIKEKDAPETYPFGV